MYVPYNTIPLLHIELYTLYVHSQTFHTFTDPPHFSSPMDDLGLMYVHRPVCQATLRGAPAAPATAPGHDGSAAPTAATSPAALRLRLRIPVGGSVDAWPRG